MNEANGDPLWLAIRQEATQAAQDEPMLASFLHMTVLRHNTLEDVLAFHLSSKLASPVMDARALMELFREALDADPAISAAARRHQRLFRPRSGLRQLLHPAAVFQGLPRHPVPAHHPLAVARRA